MAERWRLAVEGLGRIEHADAEIRPLTLLIGENNSGKSYFATLLWGLFAAGWELPSPEGPELAACEAWARASLPPATPRFDRALTEDETEMFGRLFDAALSAGKDTLLKRLFRSTKIRARSLLAFGASVAYKFYEDACALLESAMTGHIELSEGRGTKEVYYAMNGLADRLSMPLSSALVSELAPLLLVLRGAYPLRLLVVEEPESHLHPKLQRSVARALVRLVRAGVVVVVTTHSETFCQQINNFIKLGSLPDEARQRAHDRLGYEKADYLLAEEVAGHRFDVADDGKTRVSELKRTESGIVMPPFNRELANLSEEVLFLQDALAETRR